MTLKLGASQHVPLSRLMLGYSCIFPLFILEGQEGISVFHEHMFSKHPSCLDNAMQGFLRVCLGDFFPLSRIGGRQLPPTSTFNAYMPLVIWGRVMAGIVYGYGVSPVIRGGYRNFSW